MQRIVCFIIFYICCTSNIFAAKRVVNLIVGYKTVHFAGKTHEAIAINNQIPGPTLHFKEGDEVSIHVYNRLREETAIHWHGILVPWQMDGVLGVAQKGIKPGQAFHYQFTLNQSGTYWYHSHSGLQEQQGLYGAFIIDPATSSPYRYNHDFVVVLSDWINAYPEQVLANLKKTGDYYSPRFPLQPSLMKFIHDYRAAPPEQRNMVVADYKSMQKMRMGIYDINDVAYDAFLLNGHDNSKPWTAKVKPGDSVRLRFIGAGASTIFRVKIPGAMMQLVQVQGNNVKRYPVESFTIAPGETYDVLVDIRKNSPYIIYAESLDTVGAAYGALTTASHQTVNFQSVQPFPEPVPVIQQMMSTGHSMHKSMAAYSHTMTMPTEPAKMGDTIEEKILPAETSPTTQYQPMIAAVKTNDPNKPIAGVITMELFGYMDKYSWFINGVPEYKAKPIILAAAKRYRIIFKNNSMMHHPMHIHGHWFILRKGNNAYDPLLHTIDVPPGATITADVDTDASGQWFFHCHLLYHMAAGMSRVLQYQSLIELTQHEIKPQKVIHKTAYHNRPIVRVDEVRPIDLALVHHPMAHPPGFWLANRLELGADPFHNIQEITYKGLYGPDGNKLEVFTKDAEIKRGTVTDANLDIFYWHAISQFWALKGGANYFYRPSNNPYWQPGIGVEGVMPYFIDTDARGYYHVGSAKLDLELSRDTQITNNFFIRLEVRALLATKTVTDAKIGRGLNQMRYVLQPFYRITPGLNVFVEYERDQDYGAFKRIQQNAGVSAVENIWTIGFSSLF